MYKFNKTVTSISTADIKAIEVYFKNITHISVNSISELRIIIILR